MGAMGRFLGAIHPESRDRVIAGQGWVSGFLQDESGDRCLVGHAYGPAIRYIPSSPEGNRGSGLDLLFADGSLADMAEDAFDDAVDRFGLARVVRAVKMRAAREQGCSPSQISALLDTQVNEDARA